MEAIENLCVIRYEIAEERISIEIADRTFLIFNDRLFLIINASNTKVAVISIIESVNIIY